MGCRALWGLGLSCCAGAARCAPIMGAGYHTIHHTTYKHNYGHYFVYMDWLFGSLVTPEAYAAELAARGWAGAGVPGAA